LSIFLSKSCLTLLEKKIKCNGMNEEWECCFCFISLMWLDFVQVVSSLEMKVHFPPSYVSETNSVLSLVRFLLHFYCFCFIRF
jgi:hypothetical protein